MRFSNDGFLDTRDDGRVRMPGLHDEAEEPLPEKDALSFLLSHAFPGPRRIVRSLSVQHRGILQRAMWADSVNKRMGLVDRVWRAITEPSDRLDASEQPQLLQIVLYGSEWAYPLYLKDGTVRVIPEGGVPVGQVKKKRGAPRIDLQSAG